MTANTLLEGEFTHSESAGIQVSWPAVDKTAGALFQKKPMGASLAGFCIPVLEEVSDSIHSLVAVISDELALVDFSTEYVNVRSVAVRVAEGLAVIQRYFDLSQPDALSEYFFRNSDLMDFFTAVGMDLKKSSIWSTASLELVVDPEDGHETVFIDLRAGDGLSGDIESNEDELWEKYFAPATDVLAGRVALSAC